MKKVRVVLVEDGVECREAIAAQISLSNEIELVAQTGDGLESLSIIEHHRPDVVLLDVSLPNLDGIGILKRIFRMDHRPNVIMLTANSNDSVAHEAMKLGASYYIVKPFSLTELMDRILTFARPSVSSILSAETVHSVYINSLDLTITDTLHKLGFSPKLKGFFCIREGVKILMESDAQDFSITKELYPAIAKKVGGTPSRVERAIRHAIEMAWSHGNPDAQAEIFGQITYMKSRPSNAQFIMQIVDNLRLSQAVSV